MAEVTFKGDTVHTVGELPAVGQQAPDFELLGVDLAPLRLSDLRGKRVVLSIFPSIDTGVCAQSVRAFNQRAAESGADEIVCASMDLPFACKRFCAAEGIEQVRCGSAFRSPDFASAYGVRLEDGPLAGLLARAVLVIDGEGVVQHAQLVGEITEEPDYDAALGVLKD